MMAYSSINSELRLNSTTLLKFSVPQNGFFATPLDQSVDIWSFCCLVYELLTGIASFPISCMSQEQTDDSFTFNDKLT